MQDGRMVLNDAGQIAQQQWLWLINKHQYLRSHAFVVMPNHIHGLLEINCDLINNDAEMEWLGGDGEWTGREMSLERLIHNILY